MKINIIIPAYNEQRHINRFFSTLFSFLNSQEHIKKSVEVVLVDDGSSDDTSVLARQYTPHVLTHAVNLGKGAALKTGCAYAFEQLDTTHIIMMDADEQHAVSDLALFFDCIFDTKKTTVSKQEKTTEKNQKNNRDIILGVRSFTGMPLVPTLSNKFTSWLIQKIYVVYVPDIPSGYKALSKKGYEQVLWQASGYEVEVEIAQNIAAHKLPFTVIPIKTIYPEYVRGMTPLDGLKVLGKIVGLR